MTKRVLTGVAQLAGRRPVKQKVSCSIPVRAHAWVVGWSPVRVRTEGNQSIFLSHIDVSLPLLLRPFLSL